MFAEYRGIVVVAAILIAVVGGLAVYLYLELGKTNDVLADTRTTLATTEQDLNSTLGTLATTEVTLADTQDTLADTQANLRETDDALTEQRVANVALSTENRILETAKQAVEAANDDLETDLRAANDRNTALSSENEGLTADLTATTEDRDGLRVELASTNAELAGANAELTTLTTTHNELEALHMTLTTRFEELMAQAGTAEGLQEQIKTLRQEILDLEEARKPLIQGFDAKGRSGFACTGSMEPVVTCMDEATWLEDFRPEDITVGATISFSPGCWDDGDGRGTAHRVEAIEVRGGVHYYWPKGDNNLEADGCWIPEQNVRAYIVEIHRNVRPENAELREHVNAAIDAWKEAVTAYYDLYDRHCQRGRQCTVPQSVFSRLQSLERAWETAQDHFVCWQNSAKASQYPGHIPWTC